MDSSTSTKCLVWFQRFFTTVAGTLSVQYSETDWNTGRCKKVPLGDVHKKGILGNTGKYTAADEEDAWQDQMKR